MKIVVYGDADLPGSGGWCYSNALAQLGHDVVRISSSEGFEWYSSLLGRVVNKVFHGPLESDRKKHVTRLLNVVATDQPQIVIVLKGLSVSPVDVHAMQKQGSWVVNINHDDFFSKNPHNWSYAQRSAIPRYDFIFATREVNVHEVKPLNQRVEFFPFAYDPSIHRPLDISPSELGTWGADVVFVGTWEAERCRLLEYLVRHVGARYAIWGNSWEHASSQSILRPFVKGKDAMLDNMAKAIGGANVALGFLRKKNRDEYTQRTFEIPACNGVLLAERTKQHQSLFEEGVEAEFFDPKHPDELVDKVRLLLNNAAHRESIRRKGREAVLRQRHSYGDRVERILELYRECKVA